MPTKSVKVTLEVPEGVSDQTRAAVKEEAEETVVLALWKAGELSTRRAAEELGLTYHEFLDRLAARGLPVVQGPFDVEALEDARRKLGIRQP